MKMQYKVMVLLVLLLQGTTLYGKLRIKSSSLNTYSMSPSISKNKENGRSKSIHFASVKSVLPLKKIFITTLDDDSNVEPAIIGVPLVYKNPFRMSEGAHIGYELSKALEIEIIVYNIFAHKVFQTIIPKNDKGGQKEWNELPFNIDTLNGYELPAGVYFYLIMHAGKVLGKGKMAVVP
jgi:hypothetical protein